MTRIEDLGFVLTIPFGGGDQPGGPVRSPFTLQHSRYNELRINFGGEKTFGSLPHLLCSAPFTETPYPRIPSYSKSL